MRSFSSPLRLTEDHRPLLENFECGDVSVDLWIRTKALPNQARGGICTYLIIDTATNVLVGFFTLSLYSVLSESIQHHPEKKTPPIRTILLSNLGVSQDYQNIGIGRSLLRSAVDIAAQACRSMGITSIVAHPTSSRALQFLMKNGFERFDAQCLNSPMLFLNLGDLPEHKLAS